MPSSFFSGELLVGSNRRLGPVDLAEEFGTFMIWKNAGIHYRKSRADFAHYRRNLVREIEPPGVFRCSGRVLARQYVPEIGHCSDTLFA